MESTRYRNPDMRLDAEGRCELMEMHLLNADARDEKALCGAGVSAHDLIAVQDCPRRFIDGIPVGNICRA